MADKVISVLPPWPDPPAITKLEHPENQVLLNRCLKNLSFTPILGPDCSTLGRCDSLDWQKLNDRFTHLKNSIDPSEASTCRFLEAFAGLHGIDDIPLPVSPKSKRGDSSEDQDVLADFQRCLLRAAKEASALFSEAMKESAVFASEAGVHEVKADRSDCLIIALAQACVVLFPWKARPSTRSAGSFDFVSVYARLVDLICELTGKELSANVVSEIKRMSHSKGFLDSVKQCTIEERSRLTLDQVDWLFRLLWYSFSSDLRMYPTGSELAFQFALHLQNSDRNASLILAAEQRRNDDAAGELQESFGRVLRTERGEGSPLPTHRQVFYQTIAGVLAEQFSVWQAKKDNTVKLPSVAFSTAFDLELEAALHSGVGRGHGLACHHVAVPILARTGAKGKAQSELWLGWLLGTVPPGGSIEKPDWKWFPPGYVEDCLEGPLVVKLHGSPVHKLPSVSDMKEESSYEDFQHALMLPESSYMLNVVLTRYCLPQFCLDQMRSPERSFFFMGLPVNEWNMRLRVFDYIFPGDNRQPAEGQKVVISRHFDPFWSAPLAAFGVQRWRGSLENLSDDLSGFQNRSRA